METQNLTPEFRKFLADFYCPIPGAVSPHDKINGKCKCGADHKPDEFQLLAVKAFKKING